MWILDKMSLPNDWEKKFETEEEAVTELRKYICSDCLNGIDGIVDISVPGSIRFEKTPNGPPNPHSASDLLSTPCGCEFHIYDEAVGSGGWGHDAMPKSERRSS